MSQHILVEVLSQFTKVTKAEELDIRSSFPIAEFEKGSYLLREGQIAREAYFVIKGCVREFVLADGVEQTTAFFTENQSVINFNSISNQSPSKINFVCTEATSLAVLNSEKEQELYKKHPRFETFCRSGVEQMIGEKQNQLADFLTLTPKQRYLKLQNERPELINRVPQYQIASYLGIKAETLSRIRKRLSAKNSGNVS